MTAVQVEGPYSWPKCGILPEGLSHPGRPRPPHTAVVFCRVSHEVKSARRLSCRQVGRQLGTGALDELPGFPEHCALWGLRTGQDGSHCPQVLNVAPRARRLQQHPPPWKGCLRVPSRTPILVRPLSHPRKCLADRSPYGGPSQVTWRCPIGKGPHGLGGGGKG